MYVIVIFHNQISRHHKIKQSGLCCHNIFHYISNPRPDHFGADLWLAIPPISNCTLLTNHLPGSQAEESELPSLLVNDKYKYNKHNKPCLLLVRSKFKDKPHTSIAVSYSAITMRSEFKDKSQTSITESKCVLFSHHHEIKV